MNVLIVDDDVSMVYRMRDGIDWNAYGITGVFIAHRIQSAQTIFLQNRIDILFCDIEMPQGNGMELLAWLRREQYETEVIFLTCHSEFDYAQQAIAFGSFEYLVKPCSEERLREAIGRVAARVRVSHENNRYMQFGKRWGNSLSELREVFWRDLLSDSRNAGTQHVRQLAERLGVCFDPEQPVDLVLIRTRNLNYDPSARPPAGLNDIVKGLANQVLFAPPASGCVFRLEGRSARFHAAIVCGLGKADGKKDLEQACLRLIDSASKVTSCFFSCYLTRCLPADLSAACCRLEAMDASAQRSSGVFPLRQTEAAPAHAFGRLLPDMSLFRQAFRQPDGLQRITRLTADWLDAQAAVMDRKLLTHFRDAFCLEREDAFQQANLRSDETPDAPEFARLKASAVESPENMMAFVAGSVERYFEAVRRESVPDSPVEQAKAFIRGHYGEDLSLESIAAQIYLSPDYLAKLFRRETGLSVMDYLIDFRIARATALLEKTDIRIGDIAVQVGYENFSYFSKLFRQKTGISPREYRQRMQKR